MMEGMKDDGRREARKKVRREAKRMDGWIVVGWVDG